MTKVSKKRRKLQRLEAKPTGKIAKHDTTVALDSKAAAHADAATTAPPGSLP